MSPIAVTVYSKSDCVQCTATKRWLESRGVTYQEVNIEDDVKHLEAAKSYGYLAAPVVVIDTPAGEEHWSGYNPNELDRTLGKKAS